MGVSDTFFVYLSKYYDCLAYFFMNSSKCIVSEKFQVKVQDNLYYEVDMFNNIDFNVEDLKLLVETQKENFGLLLPVLVLCKEFTNTNFELMSSLSKNQNNPYSKADAFVIYSLSQKILANFYLRINKPERPTKFFNSKEEALVWLKQYM